MSNLLTVVTSTYNKGDRNRVSIQSILDQTYRDFVYIFVDDNSPDHTREVLKEFDDPRLKIFHQKNKGFVKTMISVMNQVETPYVAIQGAGDISLPERLEEQIKYLEANPRVGAVACATHQAYSSEADALGEKNKEKPKSKSLREVERIEYSTSSQMIDNNAISHGEVMIRMSAYREAGGYRPFFHYAQDRDLWFRILEKNYFIVKLDRELYYRISDPEFDIFGNPRKAEKQALYSLFARFLARERAVSGQDSLEIEGENAFDNFIERLSGTEKYELIKRVYTSALKSQSVAEIDSAVEIVHKYSPDNFITRLLERLPFAKLSFPYAQDFYHIYYWSKTYYWAKAKLQQK